MKTRILHTRFWSDPYISDCSPSEKLTYLYFLTNDRVNLCGIYEITSKEVAFFTGIPIEEIISFAKKLQADRKLFFWHGWVGIVNHEKYNSYGTGPKQVAAFSREMDYIPKEFWSALQDWDTSIHTSIYTRLKSKYIIPNKEISNEDLDSIAREIL